MNLFNRIVVTLLLLALIPIVTVSLIVPGEAVQLLQDALDDAEVEESPSWVQLIFRGGLALVIDAVLVFLLYLEVRRRRGARVVPVRAAEGGEAHVAVDSIVSRLEYHVDRLPGVLGTKIEVSGRRRGVEAQLDVETVADTLIVLNGCGGEDYTYRPSAPDNEDKLEWFEYVAYEKAAYTEGR